MSDSTISFSKDVASTIGLSEAVLLGILKESGRQGLNLEELQEVLTFWNEKELYEYLSNLLSKGLITEIKENSNSSIFVVKEIQVHSRKRSYMENSWQPEKELLDQIQEYGIPEEFTYSQVEDFKHLNQEREGKDKTWGIKFLRFVIKQWRLKEASDNQKKKRKPIDSNWKPSDEAREILVRSGVDDGFIEKEIPEFVLYWNEKREESDIWNSKFISHIRRQWSRFQDISEIDDTPFKIDSRWLPNEDFYDVLSLTEIPKEFADSTMAEFILYWKETGQSLNSWNSKFLQHVKFQWQRYAQDKNSKGQNLMDKRIESSWSISKPNKKEKKSLKVSEQTKLNFKKLKEKHQI